MKTKTKKAISLIVLVITIIVLAILATTVVITLTNGNIISFAKKTVSESDIANYKEQLSYTITDWILSGKTPQLKEKLSNEYGTENVTDNTNGSYIVLIDGYQFIVNSKGQISLNIISLNASKLTLNASDESKKTFVITASSDKLSGDVVWTTSDSSKVTVEPTSGKTNEATLTGVSAGKAIITASIGKYSETCEVNVVEYGTVAENITDFYTYSIASGGSAYYLSLNPNFKAALNSNSNYVVDGTTVWEVNTALPNPGSTFNGIPVTDTSSMFENSTAKSLDLSKWDTSNVTGMGSMFLDCAALESVNISSFNTSNVTGMYYMFSGCTNLKSIDLSGLDTSKVTTMNSTFRGCTSLTSLDLHNFNTNLVSNMQAMFEGCSNLESVNVSKFDTKSVTNMESMFSGCSNLQTLDVSGFDTSLVSSMGSMFNGCSNLMELDLSGFKTGLVTNMYNMFGGCSNLQTLDVSGFDTGLVSNMTSMFNGCSNLMELDLTKWNTPALTSLGSAFKGCSSLKILDLSNFITTGIGSIYELFANCSSLVLLDVSGFDTSGITNVRNAFDACSSLQSVLVGNETAKTTFENAKQSSSNENPNCTVTIVQNMKNLKWLALGDSITQGYYSFVPVGDEAPYRKDATKGWAYHLSLRTGMQLTNKGVGGTGFLDPKSKTDSTNGRTIIDQISNISDYDIVTIAYGINDWKGYQTLGTIDDSITAGDTIYSNMKYLVEKIREQNTTCKIIMITPLNTWAFGNYENNWGIGHRFNSTQNTLNDIFEAERAICEKYNLQMVDLTHNSLIVNKDNIKQMLLDTVHPSLECHKLLSQELSHKIKIAYAE